MCGAGKFSGVQKIYLPQFQMARLVGFHSTSHMLVRELSIMLSTSWGLLLDSCFLINSRRLDYGLFCFPFSTIPRIN